MDQNQLINCCINVMNNNQRENNEKELLNSYNYSPGAMINLIVNLINTPNVNDSVLQFCCTFLKNIISNRINSNVKDVWIMIDNQTRAIYKDTLFSQLGSDNFKIRSGISGCISAICCEEFKQNQWFEIITTLNNIACNDDINFKLSALTTLKNISQDVIPGIIPQNYLGEILFTVMKNSGSNIDLKVNLEALGILGFLIQSCKDFMQDDRKNLIIDVIMKALNINNEEIHIESFKCIYELCKCYYFELKDNVGQIINLAVMFIDSINKLPEDTKLLTLILECIICLSSTEVFLIEKNWNCNFYIKIFKNEIIHLCYKIFTLRQPDEYEDDYLPHHSASTLMENLVKICDYDVVELILGQITELLQTNNNISIDNALILFYCILDTRLPENKVKLANMLTESYNTIMGYIYNDNPSIKITTSKIIRKVAKKYFMFFNIQTQDIHLDTILKVMDMNFKPIQMNALSALTELTKNFSLMMPTSKF